MTPALKLRTSSACLLTSILKGSYNVMGKESYTNLSVHQNLQKGGACSKSPVFAYLCTRGYVCIHVHMCRGQRRECVRCPLLLCTLFPQDIPLGRAPQRTQTDSKLQQSCPIYAGVTSMHSHIRFFIWVLRNQAQVLMVETERVLPTEPSDSPHLVFICFILF